jgi:hypothetical protein
MKSNPNAILCSACALPPTSLRKLKNCACKSTQYCDKTCQRKHRKEHKKECKRLIKEMKQKKKEEDENEHRKRDTSATGVDGGPTTITKSKEEAGEFLLGKKEDVNNDDDDGKEKAKAKAKALHPKALHPKNDTDICCICLENLPKDITQFIRWTCCGQGMHDHCFEDLHSMKMGGSCPLCRAKTPSSDEEHVKYLRPWVKKKKAWAQANMGQYYRDGTGVRQSYEMARRLYELSAQQGDVNAMVNLGFMYGNGDGVEQSYERAAEYFEQAAHLGNARAQFNLGLMYECGGGVEQTYKKAKEYYEQAAHLGSAQAQFNLGCLYTNGQGIEQDLIKARDLTAKAAAQGHDGAINALQLLKKKKKKKNKKKTK